MFSGILYKQLCRVHWTIRVWLSRRQNQFLLNRTWRIFDYDLTGSINTNVIQTCPHLLRRLAVVCWTLKPKRVYIYRRKLVYLATLVKPKEACLLVCLAVTCKTEGIKLLFVCLAVPLKPKEASCLLVCLAVTLKPKQACLHASLAVTCKTVGSLFTC